MGWGTLGEVRDGSGDPRGCPGRFVGPSGRSETGWGTLGEVRDGRWTLRAVWDCLGTLGEVQNGSGDPRRGEGRVEGP